MRYINPSERLHRILSNAEARQRYDRSLTLPAWIEHIPDPAEETKTPGLQWSRFQRVWPFGLFILLLVFWSSFVDFQTWQTSRYYEVKNENRPPVFAITQPSDGRRALEKSLPPVLPTVLSADEMHRSLADFLNRYARAYRSRNTGVFLSFFDPDAMENGEPVKNLHGLYTGNFQKAQRIDYTIDLLRCSVDQENIQVDAGFHLGVKLSGKLPINSRGEMRMLLVRRGNDFKVKRLDYSFD